MSVLLETLERIMGWLQQHTPTHAASFRPGLRYNEILEAVGSLHAELPSEFFELYQWRNGSEDEQHTLFYPIMQFSPIDAALMDSEWISEDRSVEEGGFKYQGYRLFPFMCFEGDYYAVVLNSVRQPTSPVIWIPKADNQVIPCYTSITSMMLTFAECYETGAYYLNEQGYLEQNIQEVAQTSRKYNPEIAN
ncbi:MAG: SMI1/KNR4 family protein [Oculatellaceae cyanobacterium bins.114]|nr:SMI1/KNR4 family protein [Oculatellaceae cyanobacterium bins.114]